MFFSLLLVVAIFPFVSFVSVIFGLTCLLSLYIQTATNFAWSLFKYSARYIHVYKRNKKAKIWIDGGSGNIMPFFGRLLGRLVTPYQPW